MRDGKPSTWTGTQERNPGFPSPMWVPTSPTSRTGWRQERGGKASLQGASGAHWPECHLKRAIAERQWALLVQPSFRAVSSGAQQRELRDQHVAQGNR